MSHYGDWVPPPSSWTGVRRSHPYKDSAATGVSASHFTMEEGTSTKTGIAVRSGRTQMMLGFEDGTFT
jgi:hypothetical protein